MPVLFQHMQDISHCIIGGSCHKYNFCRNKHLFVATIIVFVATKTNLSQQKYVCRNKKDMFCYDKHICFVVTKMILVAAPANDTTMLLTDDSVS